MKRALFEWQQFGFRTIRPRAFGEDVDVLLFVDHVFCGVVKGGAGGFAVAAIYEDGFAEGHCRGGDVSAELLEL